MWCAARHFQSVFGDRFVAELKLAVHQRISQHPEV
jgi:hypothetical protein